MPSDGNKSQSIDLVKLTLLLWWAGFAVLIIAVLWWGVYFYQVHDLDIKATVCLAITTTDCSNIYKGANFFGALSGKGPSIPQYSPIFPNDFLAGNNTYRWRVCHPTFVEII